MLSNAGAYTMTSHSRIVVHQPCLLLLLCYSYSMGGMIALTLATRNGSQLSSVIALATTAGGPATILAPGYNPVATDSQQVDFRVLFPQGAADKGE